MIRFGIAGYALLAATALGAVPSEREFADGMMERLRAAQPDTEFRISADDPLAIEMQFEGEWGNAVVNVHRIFDLCGRLSAKECDGMAEEFIANISAPREEPRLDKLRVVVRSDDYLDYLLETIPEEAHQPPYRRIGEQLVALLAFDSPRTTAFAGLEQLRELGLTADEAWKLAQEQSRSALPALPRGAAIVKQPFAFEGYDYLPSLLADTEAWRKVVRETGPDLFVTAVSDHFVFVAVQPDGPFLDEFKQTVREDCEAQPRCVSPYIYRFRDGRWVIAD